MAEQSTKYSICELNDVRTQLNISETDTSFDERIRMIINGVSGAIERYCNWHFAARDLPAQLHDGDGTEELLLKKIPVLSVSAVVVDDSTIAAANYVFYPETGLLVFTEGDLFTKGRRNVSVTYRVGYERQDLPAEVAMAARNWTCHLFKIMKDQRYGIASQSVTEESFSFDPGTMPAEVREIANMYRVGMR